jgi:hypothetical protein
MTCHVASWGDKMLAPCTDYCHALFMAWVSVLAFGHWNLNDAWVECTDIGIIITILVWIKVGILLFIPIDKSLGICEMCAMIRFWVVISTLHIHIAYFWPDLVVFIRSNKRNYGWAETSENKQWDWTSLCWVSYICGWCHDWTKLGYLVIFPTNIWPSSVSIYLLYCPMQSDPLCQFYMIYLLIVALV